MNEGLESAPGVVLRRGDTDERIVADLAVKLAVDGILLQQVRECERVGEIVDRADTADVFLRHRAQNIAPDASETVDAVVSHKYICGLRSTIAEQVGQQPVRRGK